MGLENLSIDERKARIQAKVDALYDPNNRRQGIPVVTASRSAAAVAGPVAGSATAGTILATSGAPGARAAGAGVPGGLPTPPAQAAFNVQAAPVSVQTVSVQAAPPVAPSPHGNAPSTLTALQRLDWFIRIRVKKFQLKQSFTILFFLGTVPDDVAQWRPSPHLIGSHSEFVNSDPEHCANCKDNANIITEGFIDLDDSLERLGLGNSTEEEIEKYIKDEIHWRIQLVSRQKSLSSLGGGP